jgi:hypothetical protein
MIVGRCCVNKVMRHGWRADIVNTPTAAGNAKRWWGLSRDRARAIGAQYNAGHEYPHSIEAIGDFKRALFALIWCNRELRQMYFTDYLVEN